MLRAVMRQSPDVMRPFELDQHIGQTDSDTTHWQVKESPATVRPLFFFYCYSIKVLIFSRKRREEAKRSNRLLVDLLRTETPV